MSLKEALLYETFGPHHARCRVCPRQCLLFEGKTGFCLTRINLRGKVYSLIYGRVASLAVSPIEKKPMFHFYPGSLWLSLGSYGCNFRCPGCQNWEMAHADVQRMASKERFIRPEELVALALKMRCAGVTV